MCGFLDWLFGGSSRYGPTVTHDYKRGPDPYQEQYRPYGPGALSGLRPMTQHEYELYILRQQAGMQRQYSWAQAAGLGRLPGLGELYNELLNYPERRKGMNFNIEKIDDHLLISLAGGCVKRICHATKEEVKKVASELIDKHWDRIKNGLDVPVAPPPDVQPSAMAEQTEGKGLGEK